MRTSFGKKGMELRSTRGLSQTDFSKLTGLSLSRISQIEHGRATVTDAIVSKYILGLNCSGSDAHELRQLANYSNTKIEATKSGVKNSDLSARILAFDGRIKPDTARKIKALIDEDLGEMAPNLLLNNVATRKDKQNNAKKYKKSLLPSLTPKGFARLCILSQEIREKFCHENSRLDVIKFLEFIGVNDPTFDVDVLEVLPSYVRGAYACIVGTRGVNIVLIEEERYLAASTRVFFRHALMHEFSHHVLHSKLLESETDTYLPPAPLANLSLSDLNECTHDSGNFEQIDTLVEMEAETLATLLLVPWTQMLRATETRYLYKDYGEEERNISRVRSYFKQPAVVNAIKQELWEKGHRKHPFLTDS